MQGKNLHPTLKYSYNVCWCILNRTDLIIIFVYTLSCIFYVSNRPLKIYLLLYELCQLKRGLNVDINFEHSNVYAPPQIGPIFLIFCLGFLLGLFSACVNIQGYGYRLHIHAVSPEPLLFALNHIFACFGSYIQLCYVIYQPLKINLE